MSDVNTPISSGTPPTTAPTYYDNLGNPIAPPPQTSGGGNTGQPVTTPTTPPAPVDASAFIAEMRALFPWLDQIGLTPEFFQQLAAESASPDEVIIKLRQQPQYKARFPGLWRSDGSLRMNESQYLATEDAYRQQLRQYGFDSHYTTPASLKALFDGELDPNELRDRLRTYKDIRDNGRAVKDAFYVYAGIDINDEELYAAVVDPSARQRLVDEYNTRVASSSFDYTTWITRATERALSGVAQTLTELQRAGALTGDAVQAVLRTDPNFARDIMDALYHNAGQGGQVLNLSELTSAFEYAAIGAAATQAGLAMPTKERVAQIRAFGVDRARAQAGYTQFATAGVSRIDDAVRRATQGRFTQADFEAATFLGDAAAQGALANGLAREEAAGKAGGGFQAQLDRRGRVTQTGLRSA